MAGPVGGALRIFCLLTAGSLAGWAAEVDIGLRMHDGAVIEKIGADTDPAKSPLGIQKEGDSYGVLLVDPGHPDATKGRVLLASGETKALKRYNPDKWYPVSQDGGPLTCVQYCQSIGLINKPSPEGMKCMSGEARAKSGVDAANAAGGWSSFFIYGCWKSCPGSPAKTSSLETTHNSVANTCNNKGWCPYNAGNSHWKNRLRNGYSACYRGSQKKDRDSTDATIGCFCGSS